MALALQPASREARQKTVPAAAETAGGTPGWLGESMYGTTMKRLTCCCFTCHAGPRRMQLQSRIALAQRSCRCLAAPGLSKAAAGAVLHCSHISRCFLHDEGTARRPRARD